MLKINPTAISGSWDEGFALDVHTIDSQYIGDDEYGHPQFETTRSPIGELLYRFKYKADKSVAEDLWKAAADFVTARKWAPTIVVPVPPSRPGRHFQPVPALAQGTAKLLECEACDDCIAKVRETPELKDVYDYQERLEHLRGAYSVKTDKTRDHTILLLDDLYRSGATVEAVTTAFRSNGNIKRIFVLTITRTRSNR